MIRKIDRADGTRFQVYARRGGKQVYVSTHDSRKEAQRAETRYQATTDMIASGELPPEVDEKRTIAVGLDTWLATLKKRRSRSHTSYSWFVQVIKAALGGTGLARLTKAHVTRWRDDLAQEYAPATVNSALGCLSSAYREFIELGWVAANPCRGVKQVKSERAEAYQWIQTRPEIERLIESARGEYRDIFALALGTGMRLDELLHLRWDDVDLAGRLLTVQRGRQGTTKSGKARHVPILDSVLPLLQARALKRAGALLVFPSPGNVNYVGGGVRSKPQVGIAFKAALKRAGLDTRLRFHDLRHTFASHWVMSGGDIFRLARILGHSKVELTSKTYAHLAPEVWRQDYHRVAFAMPGEGAQVIELRPGR